MTLQNVRSLLFRGEDLGIGGGNTRELITPSQTVAVARPTIMTRAFTGSLDLSSLLPVSFPLSSVGRNRVLVNRNPRAWLTLTANVYNDTTGTATVVQIPVPPLQPYFLPANMGNSVKVTANSSWPIPVPLTGATLVAAPLVTPLNALTIDLILEN